MTRTRAWALALLLVALAAGAYLRFTALDATELSMDEGASWGAAALQTVAGVLHAQAHLNPGELGLHDLALHFWMRAFGDRLVAMRSLSALFGTLAVALVFLVARALLAVSAPESGADSWTHREVVAALAALLFAVNLIGIKYAREARMYPLALTLTLAQVWFFLRVMRLESFGALAGFALFTAAAIATTVTSILILIPEGLFLLTRPAELRRALRLALALAAALILLAPLAAIYLHNRSGGPPNLATWSWIPMPAPWATFTLFNKALGTYAFPLFAILALSGAIRAWPTRSSGVLLLLLWMLTPPLALTLGSYLIHPAFMERYLLSCFVPFFVLAALGIVELNPAALRPGALAIVLALALAHVEAWREKPHGPDWAAAATIAAAQVKAGGAIGVAPSIAIFVVIYYLRSTPPIPQIVAVNGHPAPGVLIASDRFTSAVLQDFPHVIAQPRGLIVRAR